MQRITPFLWFEDQAEEAANYYVSLFPDSKILNVTRYGPAGPGPEGSVMIVEFQLEGQRFTALNGGPGHNTFTEAISFYVRCQTQEEVDRLWQQLTDGGQEQACGWLKDRYGLCWQIIPEALPELLGDPDPQRAQRVMQAMFTMTKIDIVALERAHQDA